MLGVGKVVPVFPFIIDKLGASGSALGIPAVVGCGNTTMLLKTGDRVRVDGGAGLVEVIEEIS
jgi:hypothetical protein